MAAAAFFVRIRLPGDRKGDGGSRKSAGASGNRRQKRGGGGGGRNKKSLADPAKSGCREASRGKPRRRKRASAPAV